MNALSKKLLSYRGFLLVLILGMMVPFESTFAWRIYNDTSHDIAVTIASVEGGSTSCGAWDNADGIVIAAGGDDGPNYSDKDCNPTGKKDSDISFWILSLNNDADLSDRRGRMFCAVAALGGGFVIVYDQPRPNFSSNGSVRDNRYCVSYFAEDSGYDSSDCSGDGDFDYNGDGKCEQLVIDRSDYFADAKPENLAEMTAANRDVRFLATGDPQYWNSRIDNDTNYGVNETADETMQTIRELKQSTKHIRGIIVAGDLTQNARSDERGKYIDSQGTMDRFFFEGLGNHDVESTGLSSQVGTTRDYVGRKARNTWPTERSYDNGGDEIPHYSWDWHDVHFVQLNLFPGDDPPTGAVKKEELDPRGALQFLKDDLKDNVGTTGRPVVLTHHYGFDTFSLDYWTNGNRKAYWNAIADYNIVAIITGHSHSHPTAGWEVDWEITQDDIDNNGWNARADGRMKLRTFIAGAARGGGDYNSTTSCDDASTACLDGVFLDIVMDYCNQMIIQRKDTYGNVLVNQDAIVDFDAPTAVNVACNNPPEAINLGPLQTIENSPITFDGSKSSDPDGDTLGYRWDFDGDGVYDTLWLPDSTAQYTWLDDYTGDVVLEVRDVYGATDTDTTTVTILNAQPVIKSIVGDSIDENGTASVEVEFTEASPLDSFTITIDWGEGSPEVLNAGPGTTKFKRGYQYLDDNPSGTAADDYTVTVTVEDDDGGSDSDSTTVSVSNLSPDITSLSGDTIDEDGTATVTGTFTDTGSEDSFTVTIDWGEGSPVDYNYPAGSTEFSESHQYLDDNPTGTPSDNYTVNVTVTDDDGGSDSSSTTVTVNNLDPVIDTLTGATIDENGTATVSGVFSDTGSEDSFTVTIDWGEGSPVDYNYPVGSTGFSESHQYLDDNPTGTSSDNYTVNVTITDDDGGTDSDSTTVTVNNLDPVIASLKGDTIDENGTATVLGVFTDTGSEDSFTVTIDWGEGSPVDYNYPVGSTGFSESHQYFDDNPTGTLSDSYTVNVTVTDDDGGSDSDSTTVTVNNLDPVASIDSLVDDLTGLDITFVNQDGITVAGDIDVLVVTSSFTLSGSYSDVGTQDTHTAEVDWDDTNVAPVSITAPGSTDPTAHDYAFDAVPGSYIVALTVADDDTGSDVPTATIEVVDAAGALADSLDDLQDLLDAGGLDPEAVDALEKALSFVTGNLDGDLDGDGDGDAENGALDNLEDDELNAAQVKIRFAIEELLAAASADPSLELESALAQLVLTSRAIALTAIERVSDLPPKKGTLKKLADAEAYFADGEIALAAGDYLAAAEAYQNSTLEIQSAL